MKLKTQQNLKELHAVLDKEIWKLNELKNELIITNNFDLATEIQKTKGQLFEIQGNIITHLSENKISNKRNTFLHDNVD
jgi:cytoplasmic iron level regulating protein YaaA (DUF328/UPF0246 family)